MHFPLFPQLTEKGRKQDDTWDGQSHKTQCSREPWAYWVVTVRSLVGVEGARSRVRVPAGAAGEGFFLQGQLCVPRFISAAVPHK